MRSHTTRLVAAIALSALLLGGCGSPGTSTSADGPKGSGTSASDAGGGATTVNNCGNTYTFDAAPARVTMLNAQAVPVMDQLGVLDSVTAKAGAYPEDYFSADLNKKLKQIPTLTDRLDTTGHLQLSREEVVATTPDLVIGTASSVTPDTMRPNSIPVIEDPIMYQCSQGKVSWDNVYDHVDLYSTIFHKQERGEEVKKELKKRIDDAIAAVPKGENRTVAVLYPTTAGGVTYAYGSTSMSNPIVESAGLTNVFSDSDERVFEVSAEQIVARKPDVIIALYSDGNPEEVKHVVEQIQGADTVPAIKNHAVMPLLLNFAEPATPLNVDGLEKVVQFLGETR